MNVQQKCSLHPVGLALYCIIACKRAKTTLPSPDMALKKSCCWDKSISAKLPLVILATITFFISGTSGKSSLHQFKAKVSGMIE